MTGKERLLVLADFLENDVQPILDGAQFDMGDWGRIENGDLREIAPGDLKGLSTTAASRAAQSDGARSALRCEPKGRW